MASDQPGVFRPTILAFDTSGPYAAAALLRDNAVCGDVTEPMKRGQAERLMPLIEDMLAANDTALADLDAIACGTGPGSFTGIRISVALARGLALSLGVPAVGVSMFEVMAFDQMSDALLVSLPGPRDTAYVQPFCRGAPSGEVRQIDPDHAPVAMQLWPGMAVTGWQAERIGRQFEATWTEAGADNIPYRIAWIAERRLRDGETPAPPSPLYARAPDAALPREAPPPILS